MRRDIHRILVFLVLFTGTLWAQSKSAAAKEELQGSTGEVGQYGGHLVISQRAEAKTLNPVTAVDRPSQPPAPTVVSAWVIVTTSVLTVASGVTTDTVTRATAAARGWTV